MTTCDIAIVGAGPYGLSVAAHLRTIKGVEVRVFGKPMSFWDRYMPAGMFLRSNWTATQIAGPNSSLTLEEFIETSGSPFTIPVPLDRFVKYGQWYQRQAVPDLDQRDVTRVESDSKGFRLTLDGGETICSHRVIVAAGIAPFAWRPREFEGLPSALVSHTSEHRDFRQFVGKQVLVIGGGQSALESAALMHESGIEVEVAARASHIQWLGGLASKTLHRLAGTGLIKEILWAPTDVGPAALSQLCARPDLFNKMPRSFQDRLRKRAIRPAGARWLVDRLRNVPIRVGCSAVSAGVVGEKVKVCLSDGSERSVDHVLLGTGYKVDIAKYSFFPPKLIQAINRHNGYPRLRKGLETSVPGLHILGSPAAWSFGPVVQFVSGTTYVSNTLLRLMSRKA